MPQKISCEACANVFTETVEVCPRDRPRDEQTRYWHAHHADISGLCASALGGCRLCAEVWRYFFKEKTPEEYLVQPSFDIGITRHGFFGSGTSYRLLEWAADEVDEEGRSGERDDGDVEAVVLCFGLNSPMIKGLQERQFVLKKSSLTEQMQAMRIGLAVEEDARGNIVGFNVDAEKRWKMIDRWMQDCVLNHPLCAPRLPSLGAPWFPTRLIDVRPGPDTGRYLLIETAETRPSGDKYLTLSHVWGSGPEHQNPPYRTLEANYKERVTIGLHRDELPLCFTNAIDVSRKLGVDYIWIDSLCIIQDSDGDWRAEAGRMADVYQHAHCNLSATAASSSRDGFPRIDKEVGHPRMVSTAWTGRLGATYRVFDPLFWQERVSATRLNSRGWIFQERTLAPRVLHFGFDQVLWECAGLEAAEEFPDGIPDRYIPGGRRGVKKDMNLGARSLNSLNVASQRSLLFGPLSWITTSLAPKQKPLDANMAAKLDEIWTLAVHGYSRCELTKSRDKMVALSGVAKILAGSFGDEYLAGLWRSNLVGGLCWRVSQGRRTVQGLVPDGLYGRRWENSVRPETYRAPSWSWASVDGNIATGLLSSNDTVDVGDGSKEKGLCKQRTRPLVEVLSATVRPLTKANVFGEVASAEIRLKGEMYRMTTKRAARARPWERPLIAYRAPAADEGEIHVGVDTDEPVDFAVFDQAYFLPLMYVERRFEVKPTWAEEREKLAREIYRSMLTYDPLRGGRNLAGLEREDGYDQIQGIVVSRDEEEGKGGGYRRLGFHECDVAVWGRLKNGGEDNVLCGEFIML